MARSAFIIGVPVTDAGARHIATRSRGTPRIANRLLTRVSEYAIARADGRVDSAIAMAALAIWEVDDLGLDKVDRFILDAIVSKFGGGPVGLTTLAIAVGEEPETIEAAYEPFLVQQGLVLRTPRGRMATPAPSSTWGLRNRSRPRGPCWNGTARSVLSNSPAARRSMTNPWSLSDGPRAIVIVQHSPRRGRRTRLPRDDKHRLGEQAAVSSPVVMRLHPRRRRRGPHPHRRHRPLNQTK